MKIFDSVIQPIARFGVHSVIRATLDGTDIQQKPYTLILKLQRKTPNNACRAELGRFPLIINMHKTSLKFWMHLKSSPTESLHLKALQTQELNPEKSPLSQLVLRLTNRTNSTNTNQSQTSTASHLNITINQIIKQSKNTYLEHWDQETKTQSKLQFYRTLKSNYECVCVCVWHRERERERERERQYTDQVQAQWTQTSHRDGQTQKELLTQRAKSVCSLWDRRDRDRDALSPSLS